MAIDQLTLPLSDDDLVRLAEHRHRQADREGVTIDDYVQLVDIFPAVLQRLREKMQQAVEVIEIPQLRDAELDRICY
jgi:type IV secretory pathway VirJ component